MTIRLGLALADDNCLPPRPRPAWGEAFFTFYALLEWLERFYGIAYPPGETDFLRREQYRQCCAALLEEDDKMFYTDAFTADQRATAGSLLDGRDELIAAGFPLHRPREDWPPRLAVLGRLEQLLLDEDNDLDLLPGFADRLRRLMGELPRQRHPVLTIHLQEPRSLLSPGIERLLSTLESTGSTLIEGSTSVDAEPKKESDLSRWRQRLQSGEASQLSARGDGSLLVLRAARETHLAAYLARMVRDNPGWNPALLLPARNQTLNDALVMEGLPDLGVPVTSLGRPSLQVLKLVTVFLWKPLDLRKIMEFLNLIVKPLDHHLSQYIARLLADTPGVYGERWFAGINAYFNEILPARLAYERGITAENIRAQFDQWFNRRRYDREELIPKSEVRQLFTFLLNWSRQRIEDSGGSNQSAQLLLAAQTKRVIELIDALPEGELSFLEVDRLVRTVYEPGVTRFREPERSHLDIAYHPAAVWSEVPELIWWDFVERDPNYFFSRWTRAEIDFLRDHEIHPLSPAQQNQLLVWQWRRPILLAQNRVILCLPDRTAGEEVAPHPLLGELTATFGEEGLRRLTIDVDNMAEHKVQWPNFKWPTFAPVEVRPLAAPVARIQVERSAKLSVRAEETPTSLDKYLYYPHQWVFRYRTKLRSNDILDVAADNRLRGNLAHRAIEKMLRAKGSAAWNRAEVRVWLTENFDQLLQQEGAIFLEYGREPERVQLFNTIQFAAIALVENIQNNHWEVVATEAELRGLVAGVDIRGRADLILKRGNREKAIVDLKWRGKSTFRGLIKNQEDLQLCLYADFVKEQNVSVSTAYFIIRDGIMLGRNNAAFGEIEAISPDLDAEAVKREIVAKIERTFTWRKELLAGGRVEIRCKSTAGALEEDYLDEGLDVDDLLEMKSEDARYDDYRTLIGLIR